MNSYKSIKLKLEIFLSSNKGKHILNLFYSWGAACVILGALMEILRVPYGDIVLATSMLVEFMVFFISGFEKPQKSYNWEEVFPQLKSHNPIDKKDNKFHNLAEEEVLSDENLLAYKSIESDNTPNDISVSNIELKKAEESVKCINNLNEQLSNITNNLIQTCENITKYSEEYNNEIHTLSQNIASLNNMYELQLKSVNNQIDNIDYINISLKNIRNIYDNNVVNSNTFNEQNELMISQIRQLNLVYSKLLNALTSNNNIQQ